MASLHHPNVPTTAADRPHDDGPDPTGDLPFLRALKASMTQDTDHDAAAGRSAFSADPDPSVSGHVGTLDATRSLGIVEVALSLPTTTQPVLGVAGATAAATGGFGAAVPGWPLTAPVATATAPFTMAGTAGPATAPASAPSGLDAPVPSNGTTLVAPQVLASGTWLSNPQITLKTSLGNIVAELLPNAAPVTVANMLAHVVSGFYDDLLFHRVIKDFVVQGGGFATGLDYQTPPYAPIKLESNNGLFNNRGTLGMARTDVPNSATSQFYINHVDNNLGDENNLDYISANSPGYAVFGRVLAGLSVVDAIAAVPTNAQKVPVTDVKILEADQTRQGTVHSTTGRVDLGILAADVQTVWTGQSPTSWEYSLNAGASWVLGPSRGFTVPQGAYEAGSILVRYLGPQGTPGTANGVGGNMIVDTRAILAGDGGANRLTGTSSTDVMYGLAGNDTLDGSSGADSMVGGSGNDSYVVQDSGDTVVEASGGGSDSVSSSVTYTLPSHVEKLTLTGSNTINGTGNTSNNTITGNSKANILAGGSGNDSLNGMDGNDTLSGGSGNDLLDGGGGADSMTGGAGNDRYLVQNSSDKVIELAGGGIDSVSSGISHTLAAEVEKLTLSGTGAIEGHGNALDNTISGNSGNNLLRGSGGNDTLTGGAGGDIFRFSSDLSSTTNVDTITDFNPADDILQLENSVFSKLTSAGVLSASNFRASSTGNAAESNDFVLYETDTGQLFYDADGNGAGVKVLIATLTGLPALTSADIFVT